MEGQGGNGAPTLLLVHGAWCGRWMWEPVAGPLTERGIDVEVVERLPSAGHDAAGLDDLHADAAHVRERLLAIGGPVVLCGHSYGGMVITEVADDLAIVHSFYLAAFWPQAGQSLLDMAGEDLPDWIVDRGDGSLAISEDAAAARQALFGDLEPQAAAEAQAQLVLQSAAAFATPSSAPARSHPVTYMVCTEDQAIPLAAQEAMSVTADTKLTLQSDHCPQLSHPGAVVEALAGAVGAV